MPRERSSRDAFAWVDGLLAAGHDLAVLVVSRAGAVAAANEGAERVLGKVAVGGRAADLFTGPSAGKVERLLSDPRCHACELLVPRPGAEPEAMRFAVLPGPGGGRVLVAPEARHPRGAAALAAILSLNAELANLTRELSWRNREVECARARAEAAEAEARRMSQIQEQLAAIVAHDLRTPLSSISIAAGMLKRRGVAEEAPALDRIARSAARMTDIVGDLLDFTRARQGLGVLDRFGRADVGELCRRVVDEHLAIHPDARVEVRTEGDTHATVDRSRISQAIANLVGNALQHGDASGVDVTVTGAAEELAIVVHNGGPPIPPELLPQLFDPFRQGPSPATRSRPRGSVGLGLFIVGEIVHGHGGTIEIQSGEETGTRFIVRLPRSPRPPHGPEGRSRDPSSPAPAGAP